MALRNIISFFLILATVGAVLFCAFTGVMLMGHDVHNMASSHNGPFAHIIHATQLVTTTLNTSLFILVVSLVLSAIFAFAINFYRFNLFSQIKSILLSRRIDQEILLILKQQTNSWLSLFERSPELIVPA